MIKRAIGVGLLVIIFAIFFVAAADNSTNIALGTSSTGSIDKGYACLENQIKNRTSFSLEEAIFGTIALGSKDKLTKVITDSGSSNCWPSTGCKIKETAQVGIAYVSSGKNTKDIENWLSTKNFSTSELNWYLEVDIENHESGSCTVAYDGIKRSVQVADDMKLSMGGDGCISVSDNGYWIRVSNTCLSKTYEVSCNKDFKSSVAYQKSGQVTLYVPSESHAASSSGTTTEQIKSLCFKTGNTCDYEGTLWASLFFAKKGKDVTPYIPYLSAMASDNEKYFPSAFLDLLTSGAEFNDRIVSLQKSGKFWEITSSPYNKFYDTSLGILALGSGANEAENAKNYLISIQGKDGCWERFRDTAFILYSGWGRRGSGSADPGSSNLCTEVSGQSCERQSDCLSAGGIVRDLFECPASLNVCCSVKVTKASCSSQNGNICTSGQRCSGKSVSSSDASCCIGDCVAQTPEVISCDAPDVCRYSCLDGEQKVTGECSVSDKVCCAESGAAPSDNSGGGLGWFWIVLLMILILLVILAILYREKLKIWYYKRKSGASSTPVTRPGARPTPPGPASGMMMPRPMQRMPVQATKTVTRTVTRTAIPGRPVKKTASGDMEETLRKLREMSK